MIGSHKAASGTSSISIEWPTTFRNVSFYAESQEINVTMGSSSGSFPVPAGATLNLLGHRPASNILIERPSATAVYVWWW